MFIDIILYISINRITLSLSQASYSIKIYDISKIENLCWVSDLVVNV